MDNTVIYALIFLAVLGLVIVFEWDNISNFKTPDIKKILVILLILFFFGSALASLF